MIIRSVGLIIALNSVWPCLAQQPRLSFGGAITGNLNGEDGTAIVGGHVAVYLLPPYPKARLLRTQWSTPSGAGGSFRVEGLSEGTYRLCAEVSNSTWLNPCEWEPQSTPVASVTAAQPTATVGIVLKRGIAVPIRVEDPGQVLAQNEGRTPGSLILLGVPNDARVFRPVAVVSQDASGRNHKFVVPFNRAVKLVVHSSFFRLSDSAGTPLPRGATHIPVLVPAGVTPAPITLKVTGRN